MRSIGREKVVVQLVDGYAKAAAATPIEWVSTVATTQADIAREVTKAYTSAAREARHPLDRSRVTGVQPPEPRRNPSKGAHPKRILSEVT